MDLSTYFRLKVVIISGPPVNDINFWTPEFVFYSDWIGHVQKAHDLLDLIIF